MSHFVRIYFFNMLTRGSILTTGYISMRPAIQVLQEFMSASRIYNVSAQIICQPDLPQEEILLKKGTRYTYACGYFGLWAPIVVHPSSGSESLGQHGVGLPKHVHQPRRQKRHQDHSATYNHTNSTERKDM